MSIEALNWAFGLELEPQLKFTLVALANRADEEGTCYPSVRWISRKTCFSERTVRTHVKELETRGLLLKQGQARPDGGQSSNHYQLAIIQPGLRLSDTPLRKLQGGVQFSQGVGAGNCTGGVQIPQGAGAKSAPQETKEGNESTKQKGRGRKSAIPESFAISETVRQWARLNGYEPFLEAHLAYFKDWATNDKRYVDWDATFRNCIRADWGDVRLQARRHGASAPAEKAWWQSAPGIEAKGRELGVELGDDAFPVFKQRVYAAAGNGPWNEAHTAARVLRQATEGATP